MTFYPYLMLTDMLGICKQSSLGLRSLSSLWDGVLAFTTFGRRKNPDFALKSQIHRSSQSDLNQIISKVGWRDLKLSLDFKTRI